MEIFLSVIIPVFNEEKNLHRLFERLCPIIKSMGQGYEIITVDDGSSDRSFEILKEIQKEEKKLKIIKLRRNYGQHPATFSGFQTAQGKFIVTLDADLQNSPEDIPKLLEKIKEGYDVVSGRRAERKDSSFRRKLPSIIVNWFISRQTGLKQTDTGCFLKAFTNKAAKDIAEFTEPGGFFTATIGLLGLRYAEIDVSHAERESQGKSHYNIFMQLNQVMSLFTGYARKPFQIVELLGGFVILCGMGFCLFSWIKFGFWNQLIPFLLSVIIIMLGLILGTIGVLGEFSIRIYQCERKHPIYVIDQIIENQ